MKLATVLLALMFAMPAFAQQHAPTIEVCRADAAVWKATLTSHSEEGTPPKLSYIELTLRFDEMKACMSVDATSQDSPMANYMALALVYDVQMRSRLSSFVTRHGMFEKFLVEEATGAR